MLSNGSNGKNGKTRINTGFSIHYKERETGLENFPRGKLILSDYS